ncbi:hypothetical protein V2W45_512884 [Cenococcum geophilum]
MRALRPLPRVRGVSLRWAPGLGGAPGVYRGVRLKARAPNAEAALAQSRGTVALQACASYARGGGPFTEYVLVAGQLRGSYANCHYSSEGARCSFRASSTPATAIAATLPVRYSRASSRASSRAPVPPATATTAAANDDDDDDDDDNDNNKEEEAPPTRARPHPIGR